MRTKTHIDIQAATAAASDMLAALGFSEYATDPGLKATPGRVAKAYTELLSGYALDAETVLGTRFPAEGYDEVVVLKGIEFTSLCEHHMLPFIGVASVAYLPGADIVGLSKLARLVDMHARRLQVQERMTTDVADALVQVMSPKGVAVVIEAHHSCMGCRGVRKPSARMVTSAMRGVFRLDAAARAEVLDLMR